MRLEPGMRVRCVDAGSNCLIVTGRDYVVAARQNDMVRVNQWGVWYPIERFKPIVRVKAQCVPTLDLLMKRAVTAFNAMTPEQQETHRQEQRLSWVRGEMALSAVEHIFARAGR